MRKSTPTYIGPKILRRSLLTYLKGHNNPINGFRPVATHLSRRLCFLRAYTSWSHQLMTGFPRFPTDTRSSSLPTSADPCIKYSSHRSILRTTWPSQLSRWILIRCTTSKSLRSSYSSLLFRMRKSASTHIGPKILRRTFLLNTLKAAASEFNRVHTSAP